MAIQFPIDIFEGISIAESRFNLAPNQSVFASTFTNTVQSQQHAAGKADMWEGVITTTILSPADIKKLSARIVSLKGRLNTFLVGNPDCKLPQTFIAGDLAGDSTQLAGDSTQLAGAGSFPGIGEVDGASQTGTTLAVRNWPFSSTVLLAGDDIEVAMPAGSNQQMFKVLEDVVTDSLGSATVTIEPAIRTSPLDGAVVATERAQIVARLSDLFQGWDTNAQKTGVISLPFEEEII